MALVSFLGCAALAAMALLAQSAATALSKWVVLIVLLVATSYALVGWWRSNTGVLSWDGQAWFWSGFDDVAVRQSALVLDFQQWMLLKLHSADGAVAWLWLQSESADRPWLALRRAIVAADRPIPPQAHDVLAPEGDRL